MTPLAVAEGNRCSRGKLNLVSTQRLHRLRDGKAVRGKKTKRPTGVGHQPLSKSIRKMHIQITYPGSNNNSTFVYDGLGRNVEIVETAAGTTTSTKIFVWCGSLRCERRVGSSSITAQFFPLGETISGSSYFYSKDCPGSIREMTDGSGTIGAQYAYDPYGRSTLLQGSMASDRQFGGYYFHAPSDLCLTRTRAYASAPSVDHCSEISGAKA